MPITLTLPLWMVEKIVWLLDGSNYTGAQEIIEAIKEHTTYDLASAGRHQRRMKTR